MPDLILYVERVQNLLTTIGPNAVDVWHALGDYNENLKNFQIYKNLVFFYFKVYFCADFSFVGRPGLKDVYARTL